MIKAEFKSYGSYTTDSVSQWDLNQKLTISGLDIDVAPVLAFSCFGMYESIIVQSKLSDGVITCDVPNAILQFGKNLNVDLCSETGGQYKAFEKMIIPVNRRKKPSDYLFTDNVPLSTYESIKADLEEDINSNKTYMDKVKTELKNDNKILNGRIDTILTGTVNATKLVTVHSATIRNNSASDLTFKISSKDNETLKSIKDKSPTVINANVIAKALDGVAINGKGIPSSYNVESTNDEYVITVYSGSSSVVGQYVFMAVVTIAYKDTATDISSAELKDIRTGANGTTYPTAGDAVREQINNLKKELDDSNLDENVLQIQKNMNDISQLKESFETLRTKENIVALELTGETGFMTKSGEIASSYYRKECPIEGGKKYYIFTQFDPYLYHPQLIFLSSTNEVISVYQYKENSKISMQINAPNNATKVVINCNKINIPVICLKVDSRECNDVSLKTDLSNIVDVRYTHVDPICTVSGLVGIDGKLTEGNSFVQNIFCVTENEKYKLKTFCGNNYQDYTIYDGNCAVLDNEGAKDFAYRYYDITIPEDAKFMIVSTKSGDDVCVECGKEITLDIDNNDTIVEIQNENESFKNKIVEEQLKNDFAFSQDLIQVATFSFDDSNADIDKIEDLFEQKGVPCCFATIPKKLDEKCSSGESVREVLKRCEENGGEVLAHWQTPLTSESTDEDYYNVYVGAWKTLTQAGFMVNGIITAGGTNYNTQNFDKCIEIARPYYKYGDLTAYISENRRPEQYINMRKFIGKNTDNDIQNYIENFINNGEHSYFARWLNFASHGESDGTSSQILSDIIDYLKEKNIPIVTWNYVFTHYNSSLLEKRIKALESS